MDKGENTRVSYMPFLRPCAQNTLWLLMVSQLVKHPPAKQETLVQFLTWGDLLEKG